MLNDSGYGFEKDVLLVLVSKLTLKLTLFFPAYYFLYRCLADEDAPG